MRLKLDTYNYLMLLLLKSVYGEGHAYVGLLYLVAPISLLILNPIGIQKWDFFNLSHLYRAPFPLSTH